MAANDSLVVKAFDKLGGDYTGAVQSAKGFTSLNAWVASQAAQAGAAGGAALLVPSAHLLALAADMSVLMHKMAYCSWGVGQIINAPVEGKNDIAIILALWSRELRVSDLPQAVLEGTEKGNRAAMWLGAAPAAVNISPALVVLPGQVGQPGDGRVAADGGVGSVVVVLVQPAR